jgi:hypothetical protein
MIFYYEISYEIFCGISYEISYGISYGISYVSFYHHSVPSFVYRTQLNPPQFCHHYILLPYHPSRIQWLGIPWQYCIQLFWINYYQERNKHAANPWQMYPIWVSVPYNDRTNPRRKAPFWAICRHCRFVCHYPSKHPLYNISIFLFVRLGCNLS